MNFDFNNIPAHACGVDALYYFMETNIFYDEFYLNMLKQIQDIKDKFEAMNYEYHDNDIIVKILDHELTYSGMGRDGFHWFKHIYFRMGIKDKEKNPTMKNIRIQLNAVGFYKLGLKSVLDLINSYLLKSVSTGYYPVTRFDLNTFIQFDFSYLNKEMVVSKKKNHSATLVEKMSGYELETYYVGKNPFMLRIYNKRKEMSAKASDMKRDVMNEYFYKHGFEDDKPIFNVEFEMHREFLKEYGIDTIEDALSRAEMLFRNACDLIRLVDPLTVTDNELKSSNRNRATTQSVWSFIKLNYTLKDFLQNQTPLSKIDKITSRYSLDDGEKTLKKTLMRLFMNNSAPTFSYLLGVYQRTKDTYEFKNKIISFKSDNYTDIDEMEKDQFLDSLKFYSDTGLEKFVDKLALECEDENLDEYERNKAQIYYELAYQYMVDMGLAPDF